MLTRLLGIDFPIIQAPMAGGVTTTDLVSAVSNSGGLGMIGAGYLTTEQLRQQIREVKRETKNSFGVNLFVPTSFTISKGEVSGALQILQPIKEKLNVAMDNTELPSVEHEQNKFLEHVQVVIDENVPICSFTFGVPSKEVIAELKSHHIYLIGTATTVEEAIINEENGLDAVVVQGTEAGGHRGSFTDVEKLIGLMSLIPQVCSHISVPVIAAGGIMDGRGMIASLCLGAAAVQMGTAFLTCKESGAHPVHKKAILHSSEDHTVLTRVYSGKWARGVKNTFYEDMREYENTLPPYPIQNALTSKIRKASSQQNNPDYMSLWSGQNASLARELTAKELITTIIKEVNELKMDIICK